VEVLVSHLTRKRDGSVAARDESISCEAVRIGRSTESEVELSGPGVLLNEGSIHRRPGGIFFEAATRTSVIIDGKVGRGGPLQIGSHVKLGPYEIVVLNPPDGKDLAISVELVQPLEDSLESLRRLSITDLHETGIGKRTLAWGSLVIVLALFLVWPLVYRYSLRPAAEIPASLREAATMSRTTWPLAGDIVWTSGEISGPHKFIANNCGVCHQQAFARVPDKVCVTCHEDIRHHMSPERFNFPELTTALCESCHKEHEGPRHIVLSDQAFCVGCHGNTKSIAPGSTILDATNFGDDHPEFRPIVITDASDMSMERVPLDAAKLPAEKSNLNFPHSKHLVATGVIVPGERDRRVLECSDCHRLDAGGVGFRSTSMLTDCASCHWLNFEPTVPRRVVPHGSIENALLTMKEFYGDLGLRGGAEIEDAPAVVRRRPGSAPLTAAQRLEAMAWADQRATQAAERLFSKQVCSACHVVEKSGASWEIAPILLSTRWLPKGKFNHVKHEATPCTECHDAPKSETSADVLLPRVQVCQSCHGGEVSDARVPSTCIMCHDFHLPFQDVMRERVVRTTGR
jgi:predicted CXXCH cytochrome family protein